MSKTDALNAFRQFLAAWAKQDWYALAQLAQPSWCQGVRDAPFEQLRNLKKFQREHPGEPVPGTKTLTDKGLKVEVAIRRLQRSIEKNEVGIPWRSIKEKIGHIRPLSEPLTPPRKVRIRIKPWHDKVGHVDEDKMVDVVAEIEAEATQPGGHKVRAVVALTVRMVFEGRWSFTPVSVLKLNVERVIESQP